MQEYASVFSSCSSCLISRFDLVLILAIVMVCVVVCVCVYVLVLTYIKVAQLKRKLLDVIMPKDPLSSS